MWKLEHRRATDRRSLRYPIDRNAIDPDGY